MSDSTFLRVRWLIAGVFGLTLMGVVFGVMSQVADAAFSGKQTHSRYLLTKSQLLANDYRKQHGVFPPDLATVWSGALAPGLVDDWNRPLLYSIRNHQMEIESLGRDGVRGGVGLDADLSASKSRSDPMARLPLGQKLAQPTGQLFGAAALVCGLVVGIIVFGSLKNTPASQTSWPRFLAQLIISLVVMSAMAVFGALFIAIAHIPSGH